MLSLRLSQILPSFIPDTQGAFLKNRTTTINALMGLELIHQITNTTETHSHKLNIAIKLDLSKVIDMVARVAFLNCNSSKT